MAQQIEAQIVLSASDRTAAAFAAATKNLGAFHKRINGFAGSFNRSFAGMQKSVNALDRSASRAVGSLRSIAGLGVAGTFYGIGRAVGSATDRLDKLAETSKLIGMPGQELRQLGHIATMSGVEFGAAMQGMKKGASVFDDLRNDFGRTAARLEDVNPELLKSIANADSTAEAYRLMFKGIAAAGDEAAQMKMSEMFFGSPEMALLTKNSAADIAGMLKDFDRLGGILTQEDFDKVSVLADSVDRLRTAWSGLTDRMTVQIAPGATEFMNAATELFVQARQADWTPVSDAFKAVADAMRTIKAADITAFLQEARKTAESIHAIAKTAAAFYTNPAGETSKVAADAGKGILDWMQQPAFQKAAVPFGPPMPAKATDSTSVQDRRLADAKVQLADVQTRLATATGAERETLVAAEGRLKQTIADLSTGLDRLRASVDAANVARPVAPVAPVLPSPVTLSKPPPAPPTKSWWDSITGRAAGGPVRAGRFNVVGEKGPELVRWSDSGLVYSNADSRELLNPSAGRNDNTGLAAARAIAGPFNNVAQGLSRLDETLRRTNDFLAGLFDGVMSGGGAAGAFAGAAKAFGLGGGGSGGGGGGAVGGIARAAQSINDVLAGGNINLPRAGSPAGGARAAASIQEAMANVAGKFAGGPNANADSWMNFMMKPADQGGMGLTAAQARGAVAGMQGESGKGLNSAADNPNDRGKRSIGTAQWRDDRERNLRAFAAERGKPWQDRGVQQEFLRHEMMGSGALGGGSEAKALMALKGANTDEEAVSTWVSRFERPQYPGPGSQKRAGFLPALRKGTVTASGAARPSQGGAAGKMPASPMSMAESMLGKVEGRDRAALMDYMQTGGVNLDPATTAWCAAFMNSSLKQAGYPVTNSNMARSFMKYGTAVKNPQKGDLAVFKRGTGAQGHVGFYDSMNKDGSIRVLGGNQNNQVKYSNYSSEKLLGFRRPPQPEFAGQLPGGAQAQIAARPPQFRPAMREEEPFEPAMRGGGIGSDAAAPPAPVSATLQGRGDVNVTIRADGATVTGIQNRSEGHLRTNVGLDQTGARKFTPGVGPLNRGMA